MVHASTSSPSDAPAAFDAAKTSALIGTLDLRASNTALARRWLSFWNGNALPSRAALTPSAFKEFLPTFVLMDVTPGIGARVRLTGTEIVRVIGVELTGQDLIALTAPEFKTARLDALSRIARGAIGLSIFHVPTDFGGDALYEELILPFAFSAEHNCYPVLSHYVKLQGEALAVAAEKMDPVQRPLRYQVYPLPLDAR